MQTNPRSTAQIGGHPMHPMLVPFPIAFIFGALFTDIGYLNDGDAVWARFSTWMLGAALITSIPAGLAGFADFSGDKRIRALNQAWWHMIGNLLALLLATGNLALRLNDGPTTILPWGLTLSATTCAVIGVTGWLGGDLIYRHRVAVQETSAPPRT